MSGWHMPKGDVEKIVREARELVEAHGRRSATAEFATLAEESALFRVWWEIEQVLKRGAE